MRSVVGYICHLGSLKQFQCGLGPSGSQKILSLSLPHDHYQSRTQGIRRLFLTTLLVAKIMLLHPAALPIQTGTFLACIHFHLGFFFCCHLPLPPFPAILAKRYELVNTMAKRAAGDQPAAHALRLYLPWVTEQASVSGPWTSLTCVRPLCVWRLASWAHSYSMR